jgi:cytochrome c-type biogenesis protein CcmH/NrfF
MLTELTALTDGSLSDDEVLATFVGRYDGSIRIKPASSGLDLLAWVAPMLLLTVGAVGVGAVLMRWASLSEAAAANAVSGDDSTAGVGAKRGVDDSAARAIVERELENLGG